MPLFNQRINLIEATKLLERTPVDTMTFTKPLYHDYISLGKPVTEAGEIIYNKDINYSAVAELNYLSGYLDIEPQSKFPIYAYFIYYKAFLPTSGSLNAPFVQAKTQVQVFANNILKYTLDIPADSIEGNLLEEIDLQSSGKIEVRYIGNIKSYAKDNQYLWTLVKDATAFSSITVNAIQNILPKPDITLADVVERVLAAGLGNQNSKYKLDEKSRERLAKYIAPEFKFTRNNLYEVLIQIGGYSDVQGIPRIISDASGRLNIISYDFLSDEEWKPKDDIGEELKPIARQIEISLDDWCGGFETYAENLIDRSENGAVTQPCLQTVRTETGQIEIDDNHAIIPTARAIDKIESVEMGYIIDGKIVGEIVPYLFESSEYNNLTGYTGEYPFAKQFALCYTHGQKNITALTLKPETATALDLFGKWTEMAAVQIAQRVTGETMPSNTRICKLAYRVTYTPIITARLRQYRPYRDEHKTDNVLFYNQAGNSFDIEHYGSNVKNNLIQTGNRVEVLTFRLTRLSQKPKIGQKYKGKYISSADYEYERYWIKVTITLTENYNRKSQYVVLDSRQRFYEISERNVENRTCNFSYEVSVGKREFATDVKNLLVKSTRGMIECLTPNSDDAGKSNPYRLWYTLAQPKNKDGGNIQAPTIHELSANAFGNSVVFSWGYEDNYSAGNQSVYNANDRKLQRAVQYGDEYGEFDNLDMSFYSGESVVNTTFQDQVSTIQQQAFCDRLPAISMEDFNKRLQGRPYAPIEYNKVIMKDGGERISVTTQLHFIANQDNIVIGSALAAKCHLVANKIPKLKAVALPYEIEKWQEQININDASEIEVELTTSGLIEASKYVAIQFTGCPTGTKACALVTDKGELLVGINGNFAIANLPEIIYINYGTKPI